LTLAAAGWLTLGLAPSATTSGDWDLSITLSPWSLVLWLLGAVGWWRAGRLPRRF